MARYSADHIPKYQHYKRTNRGVVKIAGKPIYLPGPFNSAESKAAYRQELLKWADAGRDPAAHAVHQEAAVAPEAVNVEEVIVAFWTHAKTYYRDGSGKPTSELKNFADSLRTLRRLYGKTAAAKFGPKCLRACQSAMIEQGLARNTINRRIGRIRQMFKWAVGQELVPSAVLEGLRAVDGLKRGRTEAKETAPVKPVAEAHVHAVMKHASRTIAAMIELQLITGMRSGELIIMRNGDIDRGGPVWVYTPSHHKTQHHGHERIVYLGKRAQEIITPFLKLDPAAYIFSPADATGERLATRTANRKTRGSCGNRAGDNRKAKPKRTPGGRYRDTSYAKAVARACDRTFPPEAPLALAEVDRLIRGKVRRRRETDAERDARLTEKQNAELKDWQDSHRFHPHQLRHTAATRFRREHNLETARALLGQKSMKVAEVYAEIDMTKARDVMAVSG